MVPQIVPAKSIARLLLITDAFNCERILRISFAISKLQGLIGTSGNHYLGNKEARPKGTGKITTLYEERRTIPAFVRGSTFNASFMRRPLESASYEHREHLVCNSDVRNQRRQ